MESDIRNMRDVLRILAAKGTYETLRYIRNNEDVGYNSVLEYVTCNKIVASRASMHKSITKLTDMGLLERRIIQDRPFRTGYRVSESGYKVIKYLDEIVQATKYG